MHSSVLGIMIGALTTKREGGGKLAICEAEKKIKTAVGTQLISVFQHYHTVKDTIQFYQS